MYGSRPRLRPRRSQSLASAAGAASTMMISLRESRATAQPTTITGTVLPLRAVPSSPPPHRVAPATARATTLTILGGVRAPRAAEHGVRASAAVRDQAAGAYGPPQHPRRPVSPRQRSWTGVPGASAARLARPTPSVSGAGTAADSGRRKVARVSTETGPARIGTRGSPMALPQARRVAAGGKGAFVREIDRALLDNEIDLVVHCLKDIPGDVPVPDGLAFAAHLDREDVHACVVTADGRKLADLPADAKVGTSSVRRRAQTARHFPHLRLAPMRGNVNTRLAKLDRGEVDVLILAVSGLQRVDQADRIAEVLAVDTIIPPVGAGVIVLQVRADDEATRTLTQGLNHEQTALAATAERSMLWALRGHCHSPIAGHAVLGADGHLTLRGAVYSPDGATALEASRSGPAAEATAIGQAVADDLLGQGARGLIDAIAH